MSTAQLPSLVFDYEAANAAFQEWGCNCGPAALAAILGKTPDDVRAACESAGFASRHYMSPTMMQQAIPLAGGKIISKIREKVFPTHGLARIQWTGPWTAEGANPRWAYRHTHWVAAWWDRSASINQHTILFDINGGLMRVPVWERDVVPAIVASIPRADGGWFITHSWEVGR